MRQERTGTGLPGATEWDTWARPAPTTPADTRPEVRSALTGTERSPDLRGPRRTAWMEWAMRSPPSASLCLHQQVSMYHSLSSKGSEST